ncbi:MAG: response regulator transcription factor [Lewinellaceae bacterium]|nr:response regulator transcription factor [Lewinellaceae bacterium]
MKHDPPYSDKISCIAVDDEPRALEVIRLHAAKAPFLSLQRTFRSPLEALSWLKANPVQLVFLDIDMPEISGLNFLDLAGQPLMAIFTTAYSEYAVESYEQQAIDYLVKPIRFERFLKAALRAQEYWLHRRQSLAPVPGQPESPARQLFIKSGAKHYRLDVADILYLQKDGNYVWFHTAGQHVLSRFSVRQALEMLPASEFQQVHRSYIVGLRHIEVVEPHQVKVGGQVVPVAKAYREALWSALEKSGEKF